MIVDFNEILCSKDALHHNFFMGQIVSQKMVGFRCNIAAMDDGVQLRFFSLKIKHLQIITNVVSLNIVLRNRT